MPISCPLEHQILHNQWRGCWSLIQTFMTIIKTSSFNPKENNPTRREEIVPQRKAATISVPSQQQHVGKMAFWLAGRIWYMQHKRVPWYCLAITSTAGLFLRGRKDPLLYDLQLHKDSFCLSQKKNFYIFQRCIWCQDGLEKKEVPE